MGFHKKKQKTDLGKDSVGKLLLNLALPAILAQLVNMLYNIVDRIYIGHMKDTGAIALTGIGLCLPMILLVMAFSALLGMGGAPRAAIYMGKGDLESARKTLGSCVVMLTGMAVILTAVFLLFGKELLYLFGASDNTISYAWSYLRIYVCGSIFVMLSLGLNSFITTQGFSLVGMATILIGAVTNIILDPVFIFGFHMGVSGAALATILSQALSAFWVLRFLRGQKTRLRIEKRYLQIKKEYVLPVLALGVSPFVMQSTESLINISYNTSLYKYGGDLAVSAMTILSSVMQMIFLPLVGLGQGAQPIISYNYGAGNNKRVKQTFWLLFGVSLGFAAAIWAAIMAAPGIFVQFFNNSSRELYDMASWAMRIFLAGAFAMGGQMACQQAFLALGQAKASLFFACFRKLILMIPLIFLLPMFLEDQLMAVFLAEAVSDLLAAAVTITAFCILFPGILKKER
ncbi:MAG: MATE family efflux transporter [Lachnospiraceae bacterium]|nr:MATE family efflux transporter [Lachnospiraceae bacterium]